MKLNKRAVALLVSLVFLMTAAVGITVAYIVDNTPEVENIFKPSNVACQVMEGQNNLYTVENIGDTSAYVRVAVLVNWKNADGHIYAKAPTFSVILGDYWTLGKDGYYYYAKPLTTASDAKGTTSLQITTTDSLDGYTLSVEIAVSAIQATSAAVTDWSNGVASATTDGGMLSVTTQ